MIRKCHNQTPQTKPRHRREEETLDTDSRMRAKHIIKVKQSALLNRKGPRTVSYSICPNFDSL